MAFEKNSIEFYWANSGAVLGKKIVMMSLSYLPSVGGLVSYIKEFSSSLVDKGALVYVLTTNSGNSQLNPIEKIDGVCVIRESSKIKPYLLKLLTPFVLSSRIKKQITKNKDILDDADFIIVRHIYYAYALLSFPPLLKKAIFLAPLIAHKLESINSKEYGLVRRIYSKFLVVQLRLMEGRVFERFPKIGVLSESKRNEIVSNYGGKENKIIAINPGVDTNKFRPLYSSDDKAKFVRELDPNYSGELIVLTVCRLEAEKNIEELLYATSLLRGVRLYVVGDGSLRAKLERIAADGELNVRFFGRRNDVERFYRLADCFILPSFYEGFGHVFLESLSSGCPVIGVASNPPGVITASEEIITSNRLGLVASSPKAKDIAKAIQLLLSGRGDEMQKSCRQEAILKYSWGSHLEKIREVILK